MKQLRSYARSRGWIIEAEYIDTDSGSTTARRRGFVRMMRDAQDRRFEIVTWWSLDRVTREGAAATFGYLEQLRSFGVDFQDYSNPLISSLGPEGELFVAVSAIWARLERDRLIARTKAGLERARGQGKRLGRPPRLIDVEKLQELLGVTPKLTRTAIARRLKVSRSSLSRRLAQIPL